jgi:hypothetical protein
MWMIRGLVLLLVLSDGGRHNLVLVHALNTLQIATFSLCVDGSYRIVLVEQYSF